MVIELTLVDVYRYEGLPGKRFRFRVKGTRVYINVLADELDEAVKKAEEIVKRLELDKYLIEKESSTEIK
ncbi:MAG: hypothetical protein N3D82_05860 [Ignisphaera sp.]|nr:hypothetical protein [Ignisphaera sp.]MCX8168530.1 hypothetical protein [Ignisphaera sp.]MDW8085031.1 hypothetical protein [Ignisphaera sp.]